MQTGQLPAVTHRRVHVELLESSAEADKQDISIQGVKEVEIPALDSHEADLCPAYEIHLLD